MAHMSLESPTDRFINKIARLKDRAFMLKCARHFFDLHNILEVDCPILSTQASIDAHIDLMKASYLGKQSHYMHPSPEFGMKRLLAEGLGDIYQLSHVFRDEESSDKHNPEFMMAEWYRIGFNLEQMIDETVAFIRLFLGDLPSRTIDYRQAVIDFTSIDYITASDKQLFDYLQEESIPFYPGILEEGKDALLNLILAFKIEPNLGKNELLVLSHYPASQAALAKQKMIGEACVAERFEIYYNGLELANGYNELTNVQEQRFRFNESNHKRLSLGKEALPIDERFLKSLEKGLPDSSGVAVGFDRLMMLRQGQSRISDVVAWGWEEA